VLGDADVHDDPLPRPGSTPDLRGLLIDYLDFFRGMVTAKLDGLSDDELTRSVVPSGWTPSGLVHHLVNVERRWLVWGFLGEQVDDPWRDAANGGWITLALPVAGCAPCSTTRRSGRARSSRRTS
jgi:hypothetical protein